MVMILFLMLSVVHFDSQYLLVLCTEYASSMHLIMIAKLAKLTCHHHMDKSNSRKNQARERLVQFSKLDVISKAEPVGFVPSILQYLEACVASG